VKILEICYKVGKSGIVKNLQGQPFAIVPV